MKRHELQDDEWAIVEPLLPKPTAKTGRPRRDRRQMLNGLLLILSTGAQWRDLPERYGPLETVYGYFRQWRASGVFDRILDALHLRLDQERKIDWDLWCIDGTPAFAPPRKIVPIHVTPFSTAAAAADIGSESVVGSPL